jgi:MFS transporter, FSR family, fosmidomycin resistance protein
MMSTATAPLPSLRSDAQIIGLVGLAHGTSHFFQLLLPSLFPWIRDAFGLSYAQLGLLVSAFFVVSGIGQALAGFVVDRVGGLRVLIAGIGLLALAALGLAASPSYAWMLVLAGVAGLGNSVFHPADFTLLNKRVSAPRLGHAFSVHGISGTLGWAAAPVVMAGLAEWFGWRGALLVAAAGAGTVALLLTGTRRLLGPKPVHASGATAHQDSAVSLAFLRHPAVWMCFAFFFVSAMALGGVQTFVPPALTDLYGIPRTVAAASVTVFMLASAAGMVVGGFVAAHTAQHDRVVALSFAAAAGVSALLATAAVPTAMIMLLIAVLGFGSGIAAPSRDLLVRSAAPRHATGRVYGIVYSGLDVGLSIGPLMFGAMMDTHHASWVFVAIAVLQVLSLGTALGVSGVQTSARRQVA